jgi:hypothetical protein
MIIYRLLRLLSIEWYPKVFDEFKRIEKEADVVYF